FEDGDVAESFVGTRVLGTDGHHAVPQRDHSYASPVADRAHIAVGQQGTGYLGRQHASEAAGPGEEEDTASNDRGESNTENGGWDAIGRIDEWNERRPTTQAREERDEAGNEQTAAKSVDKRKRTEGPDDEEDLRPTRRRNTASKRGLEARAHVREEQDEDENEQAAAKPGNKRKRAERSDDEDDSHRQRRRSTAVEATPINSRVETRSQSKAKARENATAGGRDTDSLRGQRQISREPSIGVNTRAESTAEGFERSRRGGKGSKKARMQRVQRVVATRTSSQATTSAGTQAERLENALQSVKDDPQRRILQWYYDGQEFTIPIWICAPTVFVKQKVAKYCGTSGSEAWHEFDAVVVSPRELSASLIRKWGWVMTQWRPEECCTLVIAGYKIKQWNSMEDPAEDDPSDSTSQPHNEIPWYEVTEFCEHLPVGKGTKCYCLSCTTRGYKCYIAKLGLKNSWTKDQPLSKNERAKDTRERKAAEEREENAEQDEEEM
ncbi:hypothetical protein CALCODRAFT_539455, partial [Calocera cornea HHB12733]